MTDTSAEASALQIHIHKSLTGVERLQLAFEMSMLVRELAATRLRREHPDWSDAELVRELLRYAFLPDVLQAPLL